MMSRYPAAVWELTTRSTERRTGPVQTRVAEDCRVRQRGPIYGEFILACN